VFTFCEKRHVALHRHNSVTKWPPEVIGDFPGNEFPGNDFPENNFPGNDFPVPPAYFSSPLHADL